MKESPSPAVILDIRRGDSRDGKQPPGIVSSAPPRCVLRSGASHSLQWGGGMPALRRRFRNDDGGIILRLDWELLRKGECEAELRGTHSQAERRREEVLVFFGGLLRCREVC